MSDGGAICPQYIGDLTLPFAQRGIHIGLPQLKLPSLSMAIVRDVTQQRIHPLHALLYETQALRAALIRSVAAYAGQQFRAGADGPKGFAQIMYGYGHELAKLLPGPIQLVFTGFRCPVLRR